jgi:excisionase family DNA binding protein
MARQHDGLLTLEEVAAYLRVSRATVRRWTDAGRLRCYRPGGVRGRRLFSQEHIRRFLAEHER